MLSVPKEIFRMIAYHVQDASTLRALRCTCRNAKWGCEQVKEMKQKQWKRVYIFRVAYGLPPIGWKIFENYEEAILVHKHLSEIGYCIKSELGAMFSIQKQDLLKRF